MDLNKVLAALREELANLDAAIDSLERLQQDSRRRGHPRVLSQVSRASETAPEEDVDPDESLLEDG